MRTQATIQAPIATHSAAHSEMADGCRQAAILFQGKVGRLQKGEKGMYVCMYCIVCMYVCVHVCVYVCLYFNILN